MASDIAGGMILDEARQFVEGKRPSLNDLLLTPANAFKVMHQLTHLRGAAMKVGQLLSMDAGEILPRDLADILGHLRGSVFDWPGSPRAYQRWTRARHQNPVSRRPRQQRRR
jgi:hypothetical protein